MILGMGKLSDSSKLGRSLPEIRDRLEDDLMRHRRERKLKVGGRKLTIESIANAVMLHYLDMDDAARHAIVTRYVPRFEAMISGEDEETPAGPPPVDADIIGKPAVRRGAGHKKSG
jgi:hypothetical protein